MKQVSLPIPEIAVNRKCQFGACFEDHAYTLNGVDLCFAHGREQLEKACVSAIGLATDPRQWTLKNVG